MDRSEDKSTAVEVTSSPDVLSPGGKSRYGRTRRPKISRDFCNIDDIVFDETPPPRHSPVKSPKLKPPPKSPIINREVVFEVEDEFNKLNDLEMKVANNFKTNLQRGLDDSIKERKFFKSTPGNKVDVPNVVDVTKVFKLITTKPTVSDVQETKTTPKTALKTYSNRRKHVHDSDNFIVESFGLPDEPIIPMKSPLAIERDTKIDMDMSREVDVNLANPWHFEEFDPVPLYASEPVNEIQFKRGGMVGLFPCDNLLIDNMEIDKVFDITSNCQDTNFEKSRIPTPQEWVESNKKSEGNSRKGQSSEKGGGRKRVLRNSVAIKINKSKKNKNGDAAESEDVSLEKNNSCKESPCIPKKADVAPEDKNVKKVVTKVLNKQVSPLKKPKIDYFPKRILRSSFDNNNVEVKDYPVTTTEDSPSNIESSTAINLQNIKFNISRSIYNPQVRLVRNPLVCAQSHLEKKNLVPNPFNLDSEKLQPQQKSKINLEPTDTITETIPGINKKTVKSKSPVKCKDPPEVKIEPKEFHVGDLTWAKIGTHPYWPCIITEEPISGDYKKSIVNRKEPLFHVRFFGDRGRRSWVSGQHIMSYYGPDDLDKIANVLKAENKVKARVIKESYVIKPSKIAKWQSGVDEAESLKNKSVEERINYFFDKCTSARTMRPRLKKSDIKDETVKSEVEEGKKRMRTSVDGNKNKRIKRNSQEMKSEDVTDEIKQEADSEEDRTQGSSKPKKIPLSSESDVNIQLNDSASKRRNKSVKKLNSIDISSEQKNFEDTFQAEEADESTSSSQAQRILRTRLQRKSVRDSQDSKQLSQKDHQSSDCNKEPTNDEVPQKIKKQRRKTFLKEEQFSEESLEARKKLRNLRRKTETLEMPKEVDVPKVTKRYSMEENYSELEEKEAKTRNKRQIPGEYSNSDTDSKFSDNSSVPTSLESQAALYKRNNIFRGIPKEKFCQICEEGGEVLKCKGPCNGVYHFKCAMKKVDDENTSKEEVEKKEADQAEETLVGTKELNSVEIISVNSKMPSLNLSGSPNYKGMSLAEKIDLRMKEIMKKFDYQSVYSESTDSSGEELVVNETLEKSKEQSKLSLTITNKPSKKEVPIIKHVTADNISYICVTNEKPKEKEVFENVKENLTLFRCMWCSNDETPVCLICAKEESKSGSKFRQKCSLHQCGKYYHPECLKLWPQTQWSVIQSTKHKSSDATYDTFVCPRHVCHTCISDDPRGAVNSRCPSDKVVKCLRCPATYHTSSYCVPAGSHILTTSQIVCPRHYSNLKSRKRMQQTINANWCFICSKGGNLICCETCPTSVHTECLPGDFDKDDTFYCEDCQSGRLPLYDEIVWVKLGTFRWWPALILFPNEVPDNVRNMTHNRGEFVVKFYGTYDHYWMGRGRTFLFQEGDKGHSHSARKRVDNAFHKAITEAAAAHQLKKKFKLSKVAEKNSGLKPPPYIRIKVNKPVGHVRLFDGNTSNTTSCECDPNQPHPCGPDSDCLNRLLLTECNPDVCPAGKRCNNQCFEKREYPPLLPHRTQVRGWGLKTLAPIRKGQFVIEYVGEIIDEQEYQRRIQKMHEQKEENYYFLTIDKDRTLDAGPKGNVARFMNHSCQPNCETQKWTVNGDTRVGLFAKCDIPADTELTFNYNLECIGKEKKICRCGAPNCSGFIGVKVRTEVQQKKSKPKKKKTLPPPEVVTNENPCFVCGKMGDVGACNNKICTKYYHLECVGLTAWPEGGKWVCQWHNCTICSKRTIRCCVKCLNSFCPSHSEGMVRYDKLLGFVCFVHDPTREANLLETVEPPQSETVVPTKEGAVTSTTSEEDAKKTETEEDLDLVNLSVRLNGFMTSTPLKKSKEESSQDESKVSNVKRSVKRKIKRKRKKGKRRNAVKVDDKGNVKNTANLFNPMQNEVKLSKFTPVRYLRTNRSTAKVLNRTDPDKDLPIRKRNRLRCGNTL